MKTTIVPILFLLLIATALAEPILTPTHFNFSVYPGEMKQINITIESESNYTINFNSSNHHVEIRPKSIDILNGTYNLTLNLTFAGDIPIGEISFIIGKNITTTSTSSGGGGVGHTTRLTNATINQSELCTIGEEMCSGDSVYICLNQTGWQVKEICPDGCAENKCIIIYDNIPEDTNITQNSTDIPETSPKLSSKTIKIMIIVGIILLAGIIIFFILRERSFNEVEYLGEEETGTNEGTEETNTDTDNQEDKTDDTRNDEDNDGEHRSDSDTGTDV